MIDNKQDKEIRGVFPVLGIKWEEADGITKDAFEAAKPKFGKALIFGTMGNDSARGKDFDMLWNNNDEFKYINKPLVNYLRSFIEEEFDNDILKISKFYNAELLEEMINFKPNYIMDNTQLTEGQKRVRVSFNPNALKRVEEFKQKMADAIDAIDAVEKQVKEPPSTLIEGIDIGDFLREVATAKTELQKASMCGVGALTHDATFKVIPNN